MCLTLKYTPAIFSAREQFKSSNFKFNVDKIHQDVIINSSFQPILRYVSKQARIGSVVRVWNMFPIYIGSHAYI